MKVVNQSNNQKKEITDMTEEKSTACPCKRACERHENCIACREQPLTNMKLLPACDRIREKQREKQIEKMIYFNGFILPTGRRIDVFESLICTTNKLWLNG